MADTPKLTDAEADQLRFWLHPWGDGGLSLAERGLLSRHYKAPFPDWITALGRAALAAYDAARRRAIRVEAMQECAKAVYPFDRDAFDAVCELIDKEEA